MTALKGTASRFLVLAISIALLFASLAVSARAETPLLLADEQSGEILAARNAHARWYPASLTKLMTAYVTFRAIASGEIEDGSPVVVSREAARRPPSKMGYPVGTRLRMDTALKIIIVKSANDVSQALAEAVAGTESAFVGRMNTEARRLGMTNTNFTNSNGLHNRDQYSSARDMAVLVRAIRTEFPQYREWFATPSIATENKRYYSYNLLLERFPGTTGMKTGFVCAAGYNLAATAERNGRSLIAVVMGRESQTDRAVSAARLLLEGFSGNDTAPGNLADAPPPTIVNARNMRPVLCTEAARQSRYDPAAENAVIKSEFLQERRQTKAPLPIRTGGVDAEPSPAYAARAFTPDGAVPVPEKRPEYTLLDVDGQKIDTSSGIPPLLRSGIPIPSARPESLTQ